MNKKNINLIKSALFISIIFLLITLIPFFKGNFNLGHPLPFIILTNGNGIELSLVPLMMNLIIWTIFWLGSFWLLIRRKNKRRITYIIIALGVFLALSTAPFFFGNYILGTPLPFVDLFSDWGEGVQNITEFYWIGFITDVLFWIGTGIFFPNLITEIKQIKTKNNTN